MERCHREFCSVFFSFLFFSFFSLSFFLFSPSGNHCMALDFGWTGTWLQGAKWVSETCVFSQPVWVRFHGGQHGPVGYRREADF